MAEGFVEGGHVVGHVRGVGELGRSMHEVIHGRPARVSMWEVKVAMALVAVAWERTRWWGSEGHLEGRQPIQGDGQYVN